jgi:hypothetical protein
MRLAVRWTIGDVSSRGFELLTLSIAGARKVFGSDATCVVCVNTIGVDCAQARIGPIAREVEWHDSTCEIPQWLGPYLDPNLAEGVAWKFAPPRLFPDLHVLSLDNDVILWRMPATIRDWLQEADSLLIAEDVLACHGKFAHLCPREPRNSGIVGIPPHYDRGFHLRALLGEAGVRLSSETDEQGLQVAMVTSTKHRVVSVREVTICGYFPPHLPELGSCGAHFVGVNVKQHPEAHGFWDRMKAEVEQRVGQRFG